MTLSAPAPVVDADWGCSHHHLVSLGASTIHVFSVKVDDVEKLASRLAQIVIDSSWMASLDPGARRAYEATVGRTARALKEIFEAFSPSDGVAKEFGEFIVSMGSARALRMVLQHVQLPIAELWKPQIKQNEGFDFHTVCKAALVNFGEAKFSSSGNPHGLAFGQIDQFLGDKKHLNERINLINLVEKQAIDRLDADEFGVIAAFSLNSSDKSLVLSNAVQSAVTLAAKHKIAEVYVVGVTHAP